MSELKEYIKTRYGAAARAASSGCGCSCGGAAEENEITRGLYRAEELEGVPDGAALASLGCGNPTALAELVPGEIVLDLGSGGGIDVLLSAKRVGPTGKAYGLDMTDEMLELARKNQREAGMENAEFLRGEIEAIPLPDGAVDVIVSNCVINLAADKDRVFREAWRVLRPGGRVAVSDVVFQGDASLIPEDLRGNTEAWAGCVAGALEEDDYLARLRRAGFVDVSLTVTRVYDGAGCCEGGSPLPTGVRLVSGFIRARKPGTVAAG